MSIQSEITRITNNVQDTIDVIEQTGVSIPAGANSDNLPSLAQALANEKQDKLTGQQGQYVGFDSNGAAVATSKPTYTAADVGAMPAVSGGTAGQVLTKTEAGQEWQNAPDGLPSGGEEGQVLTKTASGAQWDDIPSDLPAGGTDGQILTKTADGVAWEDAPEGGVTSFNGRTGAVTPQTGDYTAAMVGARPSTWTPTASEVGAIPATEKGAASGVATLGTDGKLTAAQKPAYTASEVGARPSTWTPSAADVGAVPTTRTINSKPLSSDVTLTADDVGAANPPTLRTATLTTSGWSSNTQTVTVSGVLADETAQLIQPMPAIASQAAYMAAGIYCSGQAANSLTFTCQTAPTGNITVYVVMQEVSAV